MRIYNSLVREENIRLENKSDKEQEVESRADFNEAPSTKERT